MLFPYRDDNPRVMTPVVMTGLVAVTTIVWLVVQGAGSDPQLSRSVCELGAVPGRVLGRELAPTLTPRGPILVCDAGGIGTAGLLTSVFLHGGWFHLLSNMWFLWVFGDNVEDSMGHTRFVGFYLVCGVIAALAQVLASPASSVPLVGASGAISGVMGAYLVLYPMVPVHSLLFLGFFVTTVALPAWMMLLYWAGIQLIGSVAAPAGGGGTAFLAHFAGFVAGIVLIRLFADPRLVSMHQVRRSRSRFSRVA